jgi:flavin-dependent dehydrogenase
LETGYRRVVAECAPELADELAGKQPSERFRGFPGHPGLMRRSHGPGWALVGDAGYFKDPITAHGITDALRDAELLAHAIVRGTDAALAEYQALRDQLSVGLFAITDEIASFAWDLPRVQALHKSLSEEMNREVSLLTAA